MMKPLGGEGEGHYSQGQSVSSSHFQGWRGNMDSQVTEKEN